MQQPINENGQEQKLNLAIAGLAIVAFWSVWLFYSERMFDGSDEPLGVVALISFIAFALKKKAADRPQISMYLSIIFLLCYVITFFSISKLASAFLAVLSIASLISWLIVPLKVQEYVLALLSLPLVASINFYLGYPLRVMVAKLAALMLALGGVMAKPVGTMLEFQGKTVYVDAPCGGVKLMWFSLFTTACLCSYLNWSTRKSIIFLSLAFLLSILANSLRVTSLFYVETGLVKLPYWNESILHQAIGLIIQLFLLAGIVLLILNYRKDDTEKVNQEPPKARRKENKIALALVLCLLMISSILPFIRSKSTTKITRKSISFHLPEALSNESLSQVEMPERHKPFLKDFPGTVKLFRNPDNSLLVVKFIKTATRKVHPASDCYKGAGYKIEWEPIEIKESGSAWSHFLAIKGQTRLSVKERIIDSQGNQWTDASSWYWSALLGETKAPWWGITLEEGGLN